MKQRNPLMDMLNTITAIFEIAAMPQEKTITDETNEMIEDAHNTAFGERQMLVDSPVIAEPKSEQLVENGFHASELVSPVKKKLKPLSKARKLEIAKEELKEIYEEIKKVSESGEIQYYLNTNGLKGKTLSDIMDIIEDDLIDNGFNTDSYLDYDDDVNDKLAVIQITW